MASSGQSPQITSEKAPFWDFSVRLYGAPGVADACLALQDEHGVDVNFLLLCLWHGRHYGEFDRQQLRTLLDFSSDWSGNVVVPLRQVRRWLKLSLPTPETPGGGETGIDAQTQLRNQIKKLELEAEKLQQQGLEELLGEPATDSQSDVEKNMGNNLALYLQILSVEQTPAVQQQLEPMLRAALQ